MREILFRGKRLDNGEWVEGTYLHLNVGKEYICPGTIWIGTLQPCKYDVDPATIGQYTGLKDKNGKRIFEGDIVKVELHDSNDEKWCETRKVQYSEKECCWYPMRWQEYCEICNSYTDIVSIEIVGNAHDNPELLEVHHE